MPSTLAQKAFFGSIHQYIAALIAIFFSGLTSVLIIRNLTVDDYGVYSFLINIIAMAQFITSLGLVYLLNIESLKMPMTILAAISMLYSFINYTVVFFRRISN